MIHIRIIRHSSLHLKSKEESIGRIQCLGLCNRLFLFPDKIGDTEKQEKSFQQTQKNPHREFISSYVFNFQII